MLELGPEEKYNASGQSIKKAQHAAAELALTQTLFKHPPPKTHHNSFRSCKWPKRSILIPFYIQGQGQVIYSDQMVLCRGDIILMIRLVADLDSVFRSLLLTVTNVIAWNLIFCWLF